MWPSTQWEPILAARSHLEPIRVRYKAISCSISIFPVCYTLARVTLRTIACPPVPPHSLCTCKQLTPLPSRRLPTGLPGFHHRHCHPCFASLRKSGKRLSGRTPYRWLLMPPCGTHYTCSKEPL